MFQPVLLGLKQWMWNRVHEYRFTRRCCHGDTEGDESLFVRCDGIVLAAQHRLHLLWAGRQVWKSERERERVRETQSPTHIQYGEVTLTCKTCVTHFIHIFLRLKRWKVFFQLRLASRMIPTHHQATKPKLFLVYGPPPGPGFVLSLL